MLHQWQHYFALTGCFGQETAERLKKPAQAIVLFCFVLVFFVHRHQLQYKDRKLAKADN